MYSETRVEDEHEEEHEEEHDDEADFLGGMENANAWPDRDSVNVIVREVANVAIVLVDGRSMVPMLVFQSRE